MTSHDGEKYTTKNECATRVSGGNDDDDDDGTPAIPKTLKEFILIKIKTSFKTPNNDTKETEKRIPWTSEMETNAFAYYVMVNLMPRTFLPTVYVVQHRCFDHHHLPCTIIAVVFSFNLPDDFYFGQYCAYRTHGCTNTAKSWMSWYAGQVRHSFFFFIC